MNTVEKWREGVDVALDRLEKETRDHPIPENREAANAMQDDVRRLTREIRERIERGPES